jgi:hypothetical protein
MIDLFGLWLLSVLAVYRPARMIALEDGPGNVFMDVRGSLLGMPLWVQKGVSCPLCIGFWLSGIPAAILTLCLALPLWSFFGLWAAIAGGQAFLWDLVSDDS